MGTIGNRPTSSTSQKARKAPAGHAARAHALLSASGANRWLNCTPSARLEEKYGEKTTSVFAQEGTTAHELAELYLRHDLLRTIDDASFEIELEKIMSKELFSEEMLNIVPIYTDYCTEQYQAAHENNSYAVIQVEQKLDLTEYIPESFGTGDCIIISDGLMEVIDLKYGKGVPVYADWNKQLMLYGLGALRIFDTMYDIGEVRLTIVQPRINNISSWQISVKELTDWAVNELKPKADMAFKGLGELSSGAWCQFCSVKNRCRALADQQLEIAKHDFADPELLTDEEIADIVLKTPALEKWANSIAEYAREKALNEGKQWPGLKLVEGISRRKWLDEEQAGNIIFTRFPELSEDQVFDMKLKSITALEKIVGKKAFSEKLKDAITLTPGSPALVSENDKRPAMGVS